MKRLHKILFIPLLFLIVGSCDDFLDPEPVSFITQDNFYESDEDLEVATLNMYDGLQGTTDPQITGFRSTQIEYLVTEMRTDNARSRGDADATSAFRQFEVYQVNANNIVVQNYYESMYNVIFRANLVIDNLDAASEIMRDSFEGEAKFVRAYAFFQLVRIFGAVPMPLNVITLQDTDISFTRIATDIVYDQIIDCLLYTSDAADD